MSNTRKIRRGSFWDWWRSVINRGPVTFIPAYDSITPFDYSRPDLELLWDRVEALIDELAAKGAFDEEHSDIADRLIHEEMRGWRAELEYHKGVRNRIFEQLIAQGVEHQVRLQIKLERIGKKLSRARTTYAEHWAALSGLPDPDRRDDPESGKHEITRLFPIDFWESEVDDLRASGTGS